MTVDESAVDRLTTAVEGLREDVQALRRRWRWMTVAAAIAAVLLIVAGVNLRYSLHQAECVRDLVNKQADRSNALALPLLTKLHADDAFMKSVGNTKDRALQTELYRQMVKADDAYEQAYSENPPPPARHYAC